MGNAKVSQPSLFSKSEIDNLESRRGSIARKHIRAGPVVEKTVTTYEKNVYVGGLVHNIVMGPNKEVIEINLLGPPVR